jgi:cellulose biosynthesis protein BcsQ
MTDHLQPPRAIPGTQLVIAYAVIKGGVAKSTSAWQTLIEAARRGYRALGVDCDRTSQTLSDSYQVALGRGYDVPFQVVTCYQAEGMAESIRQAARIAEADLVVLDVGGGDLDAVNAALMLADELVMPCAPHEFELRRLPATVAAARAVHAIHPLGMTVLLVKCDRTAADAATAATYLESKNYPLAQTRIPETVMYKRALGHIGDTGAYAAFLDELLALRAAEEVDA